MKPHPTIVCLCGSTRFMDAFQAANLRETLAGKIVLTVGCDTKSDAMLHLSEDVKAMLDELHKEKIKLADEVLILNVGGYVGQSTMSELVFARVWGKRIRWLEPDLSIDPLTLTSMLAKARGEGSELASLPNRSKESEATHE